jgi:hypothetical protein
MRIPGCPELVAPPDRPGAALTIALEAKPRTLDEILARDGSRPMTSGEVAQHFG